MITYSKRLKNVHRIFDPYNDRRGYIRLDRNEDPIGYDNAFFDAWKSQLAIDDIAAYADSHILIEKLSKWLEVNQDEIYITAGSDALIKNIFETYIDSNDVIVMQKPNWRMYDVYTAIYGAEAKHICYGGDFSLDLEKIIQKIETQNVRMLILANPNQPTATLIKTEQLEKIIHVCEQNNTLVVIDEAYHLFTSETAVKYIKKYDNLIIARTFSKAFGLAGLRIGYAVANSKRIKDLMLLRPVTDANSLAINFSSYLLDNIDKVREKINDFNVGRDFLYNKIIENNIKCSKSYTNFLLIPCLNEESAKELIAFAKNKKYLLKGPFKEDPLNNYVRITTGSLSLMQKFWEDSCCGILKFSVKNIY
jgi:histidinol-phosphate aminotransferase